MKEKKHGTHASGITISEQHEKINFDSKIWRDQPEAKVIEDCNIKFSFELIGPNDEDEVLIIREIIHGKQESKNNECLHLKITRNSVNGHIFKQCSFCKADLGDY